MHHTDAEKDEEQKNVRFKDGFNIKNFHNESLSCAFFPVL